LVTAFDFGYRFPAEISCGGGDGSCALLVTLSGDCGLWTCTAIYTVFARSQNAPCNFVAYLFFHHVLGTRASTDTKSEIPIVKVKELPQRADI